MVYDRLSVVDHGDARTAPKLDAGETFPSPTCTKIPAEKSRASSRGDASGEAGPAQGASGSRNLSGLSGSQVRRGTSTVTVFIDKGGFYEQVISTAGQLYALSTDLRSVGRVGDLSNALSWFDMKNMLAELAATSRPVEEPQCAACGGAFLQDGVDLVPCLRVDDPIVLAWMAVALLDRRANADTA